ncbi:MAG: hypothetical protein DLM58_18480 [Pseudonocardiales bacterium]|nr:MAG: hypothetical protein DLM58_18480 [Pseudonocardiales bacterium]
MTPATTAVTGALPQAQQGIGSAMNDLARSSLALASRLGEPVTRHAQTAFVDGMQSALLYAAAAVAATAIAVAVLLRGSGSAESGPQLGGDGRRAEQGLQVTHEAG